MTDCEILQRTGDREAKILKLIRSLEPPVNLSYVNNCLSELTYNQVRYSINKLEDENLLITEKKDGLRWIWVFDSDETRRRQKSVNLRDTWHDSNMDGEGLYSRFMKVQKRELYEDADSPGELIRGLKTEAGKIVSKWTEIPDPEMDRLDEMFIAYLEEINDLSMVFKRDGASAELESFTKDQVDNDSDYLFLDYETRFNSKSRRSQMWGRYYSAWAKATKWYDTESHGLSGNFPEEEGFEEGVFLTLTTDPKRFENNTEAVRHISKSWNRFMSWVDRRIGYRPPYIKVLEFTEDGKPHLHICLFGISRIAPQREISNKWSGHGQGEIVHLHKIENRNGSWVWPKDKPDRAENDDDDDYNPIEYLSNEFSKQLKEKSSLALHWIHQTNFFTTSQDLKVYVCGNPDCEKKFGTKKDRKNHEADCYLRTAILESESWEFRTALPHSEISLEMRDKGSYVPSRKISPDGLKDFQAHMTDFG